MSLNPFAKEFVPNTFHFAGLGSKSNVTRGVPRIEENKKQSYAAIAAKDMKVEEAVNLDQNSVDTSNWYVISKNVDVTPEIKPSADNVNCKLFVTKVEISSKMSDYWCDITSKSKCKSLIPVEDKTAGNNSVNTASNNNSVNTASTSLWHGILQSSVKYSNNVLNSIVESKNNFNNAGGDIINIDALQIFNKIRADDNRFISSLVSFEALLTIIDPISGLDVITFLCTLGKLEMLKMILLLDVGNMKKINYSKATIITLLQVAVSSTDVEVLKSVTKLGDISLKCGNKENILHKAVNANNTNLLKYLLINKESSNKLYINCRNKQGETPLFYAKSRDAIVILMNYGANPYIINEENDNVFGKLVRMNKYNLLNFLLATNSNSNNYKQIETMKVNNPLHIASHLGFVDCIKILLQADRYDINARDYYTNDTPLICACRNYQKDVIKYLLSMNADPFIECSDGFPPLLLVCNDSNIINIFLENKKLVEFYSNDASFMMKLLKYVINDAHSESSNKITVISYYITSLRLVVPKKALYFLIKNVNKSSVTLEVLMNRKIFDNLAGEMHISNRNNSNEITFDVIVEDITICSIGFNSTLLYCVSTVFAMLIDKRKTHSFDGLIHTHYDQKYILIFQKWLYNSYLSHDECRSQSNLSNLNGSDLIELLHFSNEFIIESLHYDCQLAFIKSNHYSNIEIDLIQNLICALNLDLIHSFYSRNDNVDVYDSMNNSMASTGKNYYKNITYQCTDNIRNGNETNGAHYDLLLVTSDNKFVYCHKVILHNFSKKFKGMIKFHGENLDLSMLTLRLAFNFDEVSMLLEWMYFGNINTTNKSYLCRLLILADEYIMTSLTHRLESMLLDVIRDDLELIVEVLNTTYSVDTSTLKKLCVVSTALYLLKYKEIVNNYDIVNSGNCNINEEIVTDALNLLLT